MLHYCYHRRRLCGSVFDNSNRRRLVLAILASTLPNSASVVDNSSSTNGSVGRARLRQFPIHHKTHHPWTSTRISRSQGVAFVGRRGFLGLSAGSQYLFFRPSFASRGSASSLHPTSSTVSFPSWSSSTPTVKRMSSASDRHDEVDAAKKAALMDSSAPSSTIFDKIILGEIPSTKVHEDSLCLAFRDVNPQAPTHILLIPKERSNLTQLSRAKEEQIPLLGHLLFVAQSVGKAECPDGFRVIINDGKDAAQSVYHLHLHIMGGRQMGWPPG